MGNGETDIERKEGVMSRVFAPWELIVVWASAMILGGITLHFVHLIRDRGVKVEVSEPTLLLFSVAAWASWALNVVAAILVLTQRLLDIPLPFNPWVLGAAASPIALPLGQMRGVLRATLAPAASMRLTQ